jgi:hypothetical protein
LKGALSVTRTEQEALEEARRPRGCPSCGLTFIGQAFAVHRDPDWPGGCLPRGALGQLEDRDGVWCLPSLALSASVITTLINITMLNEHR